MLSGGTGRGGPLTEFTYVGPGGSAGGRSSRDPEEFRVPFEPANALGSRVLSPASEALAGVAGRLAELEHPRTVTQSGGAEER